MKSVASSVIRLILFLSAVGIGTTSWAQDQTDSNTQVNSSSEVPEDRPCDDIAPGQKRTVQYTSSASTTGLKASYVLERLPNSSSGAKKYAAHINVGFKKSGESKLDPQLTKKMVDRANYCVQQGNIAPRLKDKTGNSIKLIIHSSLESSDIKLARPSDISISGRGNRSFRDSWASDIDCKTMTHELLHQLGLCDEYNDCEFFPGNCNNCRAIGAKDSAMNNYDRAFSDRIIKVKYQPCACVGAKIDNVFNRRNTLRNFFGPSLSDQIAALNKQNRPPGICDVEKSYYQSALDAPNNPNNAAKVNCPPGFTASGSYPHTFEGTMNDYKKFMYLTVMQGGMGGSNPINITSISDEPTPENVLSPGHINAIAYSGCSSKNTLFNSCSRSAYKQASSKNKCPKTPSDCDKAGEWAK